MKSVDYQQIMTPTVREALCQINTQKYDSPNLN
jgi:hypothetical protein